jgi:choline dehydrogenase
MTCAGWVHRTESRGYVRARSADPFAPPIIQPNYLAHELDRRGALAALRLARRILRSAPLAPYYDGEKTPGEEIEGDDELLAYGRESCSACYHPMGTCRMGRHDDPGAVVNAELRVHGLEGLRVVDASVMPTMPSGNLNAPTLMIAEKASDMILGRPPLPPAEL